MTLYIQFLTLTLQDYSNNYPKMGNCLGFPIHNKWSLRSEYDLIIKEPLLAQGLVGGEKDNGEGDGRQIWSKNTIYVWKCCNETH